MMWCRTAFVLALTLPWLAVCVRGDLAPERIRHAKRATALVEIPPGRVLMTPRGDRVVSQEKSFGTAFCIDGNSGVFVTNAHVVDAAVEKELTLVLDASEKDQRVVTARVVRSDKTLDLALLQVRQDKPIAALELDSSDDLMETQSVLAFGFPFGAKLSLEKDDYPSISVNVGRITSLRKRKGELEIIQLDAALNPGNSGGPVLTATTGRVIGIVQSGVVGSGVNFAVPASRLHKLLAKPEILFSEPTLTASNLHRPTKFELRLVSLAKPAPEYVVTAALTVGGSRREFPCRAGPKNTYWFETAPFPGAADGARLQVEARFARGSIRAVCGDRAMKLGGQDVSFSEIRQILGGERSTAVLNDGRRIEIRPGELKPHRVDLGDLALDLDLGRAQEVIVDRLDRPVRSVEYVLTVNLNGEVLAKQEGSIPVAHVPTTNPTAPPTSAPVTRAAPVTGSPATTTRTTTTAPSPATQVGHLETSPFEVALPGTVDDVAAGASGRLLILRFGSLRKLAVFDVAAGKVVKLLPLVSEDAVFAATAEKLLVVACEQSIVQRWDLKTLERETTTRLPDMDPVDHLAAGHSSSGPAMLLVRGKPKFLDINTLKLLNITDNSLPWMRGSVRASGDGTTFAGWATNTDPSGIRLMTLSGNTLRCLYEHRRAHPLLPSHDGRFLFTADGIFSSDLKPLTDAFRNVQCLPSYHPSFFMALSAREPGSGGYRNLEVSLHSVSDRRLLTKLPTLAELRNPESIRGPFHPMSADKFIHLIPQHKALVTLNAAADRLVVRRFDVGEALVRDGAAFLFVESLPPRTALRGEKWRYRPEVRSKRGGTRIAIDSCPAGMVLSDAGVLEWDVPTTQAPDSKVSVILAIRDASGQELFHSFVVLVH